MEQNQIEAVEEKLLVDRGTFFRGTARIRFQHLRFGQTVLLISRIGLDIGADLKAALSEEYSNSINFSDGEIFLKLREYHYDSNKQVGTVFAEKRMWGRLSRDKRKDLKQILKHKTILAGLDALRILPGHFEIAQYLKHILETSRKIFEGKEALMRCLDGQSVAIIQLRAPGLLCKDHSVLEKAFQNGELFPSIRNQSDRQEIWKNLQLIEYLIPSLHSLIEDIKYLKTPAKIVRRLCPPGSFSTREAMYRIFTGRCLKENEMPIFTSTRSQSMAKINPVFQFELCYREVWLCAWRYWAEMLPDCPKKEDGEDTPIPRRPNPRIWKGLADLAATVGFESDEIQRLIDSNPDREIAIDSLLNARNPDYFEYDQASFESYVTTLINTFNSAKPKPEELPIPSLLVPGNGEGLERRCGRAFSNGYKHDQKYLLQPYIFDARRGEGQGVSAFAVRRSVFCAFFGWLSLTDVMQSTSVQELNQTIEEPLLGTLEPEAQPVIHVEAQLISSDAPATTSVPATQTEAQLISSGALATTLVPASLPATPIKAPLISSMALATTSVPAPSQDLSEQRSELIITKASDTNMLDFNLRDNSTPDVLFVYWVNRDLTQRKRVPDNRASVEEFAIR
ncbi:Intracellular protein transport protein USO1 [Ilyonectria robusta]